MKHQIWKTGKDRFTGPMYYKLWWPAMLSSAGWALSDMADAVVVGQRMGHRPCSHQPDSSGVHDQLYGGSWIRAGRLHSVFHTVKQRAGGKGEKGFQRYFAGSGCVQPVNSGFRQSVYHTASGAFRHGQRGRRPVLLNQGLSADTSGGGAPVLSVQYSQLFSAQRQLSENCRHRLCDRQYL